MKWTFAELSKYLWDFFYYLVGVLMDGSKGEGWKTKLFVWCFITAAVVVIVLLVRVIVLSTL